MTLATWNQERLKRPLLREAGPLLRILRPLDPTWVCARISIDRDILLEEGT